MTNNDKVCTDSYTKLQHINAETRAKINVVCCDGNIEDDVLIYNIWNIIKWNSQKVDELFGPMGECLAPRAPRIDKE